MSTLGRLWSRLMCRLGRCRERALYSTDDGIGGRCVRCGRIHGWMTRDELRAEVERLRADRVSDDV